MATTTINVNTAITNGVTPINSGTSGRIFYQNSANKISQSDNLFFDEVNSRLSLGQGSSPGARLDVRAQGALSTDIAFRVRNSADTRNMFEVLGNSVVRGTNGSNTSFEFAPSAYRFHQSVQGFSTNGAVMFEAQNISGNSIGSLRTHNTAGNVLVHLTGNVESLAINGKIAINRGASARVVLAASLAGGFLTGVNYASFINGTTPSFEADMFKMYASDIVAGNSAPHFVTENGSVIKLYKQNLPTTPTTTEIATLLSNLGLANLI